MIREYLDRALERATFDCLEDGTFVGEVSELPGVLAHGTSLEACREQLTEVIEEWVLVRVSRSLPVPSIGGVTVAVTETG